MEVPVQPQARGHKILGSLNESDSALAVWRWENSKTSQEDGCTPSSKFKIPPERFWWQPVLLFSPFKCTSFCFHLVAFLVNEYFTPEEQKNVRDITREVVDALS